MFDYFKVQEYFIDHIWFNYDGRKYTGTGILNWNPDDGFRITAHIRTSKPKLPLEKEFRSISFDRSICVYMNLKSGLRAIAPQTFPDELGLIHGRFTANTSRVLFVQKSTIPIKTSWFGTALFEIRKKLLFPDVVTVERKIGDGEPRRSSSRAGINFADDDGIKVIGHQTEDKFIELNWNLPLQKWSKEESWAFAKGLQNSISLMSGEVLKLKYREVYRANRIIREVVFTDAPTSLGTIFRPLDYEILDREMIVALTKFFVRGEKKADISLRIFQQMADASRQHTKQGQELLLATILEAALRSIYDIPFEVDKPKGKKKFLLNHFLRRFREDYLIPSPEDNRKWTTVTTKVSKTYRRLRHRNAHPDWLSSVGGAYSKEEMEKATNDVIFLSRFYGFMIMGLANFRVSQPPFPKPLAEWNPIMTVTIGNPKKSS